MEEKRNVAIVLAAGQGKRMNTSVQKQYLLLKGKPVLYYALRAFEDCPFMDEVVLVTGKDEIEYCQREIVDRFGFSKVKKIVPGEKSGITLSMRDSKQWRAVTMSISMTEPDPLWIRRFFRGPMRRLSAPEPVWSVCL